MARTRAYVTVAFAENLRAPCDLDLQLSDMVLACDTLSFHDDCLCQIILKSYYSVLHPIAINVKFSRERLAPQGLTSFL